LVDSQLGQGSTIRVLFPAADEAPRIQRSEKPTEPQSQRTPTGYALVVDDENAVRRLATRVIERMGYSVLEASDGLQAVEMVEQYADEIAFVLLDLTMPRMDGAQAAQAIKRIKPNAITILCSGYDHDAAMEQLGEIGVAGFLQKPYKVASLRLIVQRVLADTEH